MNLWFALWVAGRAWFSHDEVHLMIHEPFVQFSWRPFQGIAACVHRLMLAVACSGATRLWLSIPNWSTEIRPYVPGRTPVRWLPIPAPQLRDATADDPRIVGTVDAIQRDLSEDGLVMRYETSATDSAGEVDGLPGSEGSFLACSFWLSDALYRLGRVDEARSQFERLLDLRNDVGLLAEEYDPRHGRQVGNYPQAFSHIGLVSTAYTLNGVVSLGQSARSMPPKT